MAIWFFCPIEKSPSDSLLEDWESLVSEYWLSPGRTDGNTPITVATCGLCGCVVCGEPPSTVGMELVSGSTLSCVLGADEHDGSAAVKKWESACSITILSFRTDMPGQSVQTQIRLLSVYTVCNSLCIFWMHYSKEKPSCSTLRLITANFRVSEILRYLWYVWERGSTRKIYYLKKKQKNKSGHWHLLWYLF